MSKQDNPEAERRPSPSALASEESAPRKSSLSANTEEEILDGGSIQDLQSSYIRPPSGYSENQHDGRRRAWIALISFGLLAVLICGHYALVALFTWFGKDVKFMETAFNTALPVTSGLAGTVAAFYFRDKDRGKQDDVELNPLD